MSLLMKKRQLESLRNNGLNDTHAGEIHLSGTTDGHSNNFSHSPVKPQTMASQKSNGDSWETMGMQMKTPTTTYAEASHPEAMNHLQPQTTRSRSKQQEEAVTIESLLQQSFQQRGVGRSERKISTVPSWTVPTTAPMTNNEAMGYQVAVNNDYKLPEGAYYGEMFEKRLTPFI